MKTTKLNKRSDLRHNTQHAHLYLQTVTAVGTCNYCTFFPIVSMIKSVLLSLASEIGAARRRGARASRVTSGYGTFIEVGTYSALTHYFHLYQ